MQPIQVLIVDDDDLLRQEMCAWLESAKDIMIVGAAKDHRQGMSLIRETQPDVLLLGIDSLGANNFPAILTQIQSRFPRLKILVLHEDGQQDLVLEAFKAGAMGHLVKGTVRPDELAEAIRTVHRGEVVLSSRLAGSILDKVTRKRLQESPAPHRD
jgi:DNA-binding NarL/FixJ family response regulator